MWTLYKLSKDVLSDRQTTLEWCISKGLIKHPKCEICDEKMKLKVNEGFFKCKHNGTYIKKSVRDSSWFETSKLSIEVIFILTYLFSIGNCKYEIIKR